MKMRFWLGCAAVAALALVAGCGDNQGNSVAPPPGGQKIAAIAPPAGTDWTQVVSATPDGGFRMGNPKAPVKLLEYGSFGCHVCADFDIDGADALENYIKTGRVSWEFRSVLFFPTDLGVTLLTGCHGPEAFFLLKKQLYVSQEEWTNRMKENAAQYQQLAPEQQLKGALEAAGLDAFFRQRGMPQAKIDSCLADRPALERALAVSKQATDDPSFSGTPTFHINGRTVERTGNWATLEPQLKRALGE